MVGVYTDAKPKLDHEEILYYGNHKYFKESGATSVKALSIDTMLT